MLRELFSIILRMSANCQAQANRGRLDHCDNAWRITSCGLSRRGHQSAMAKILHACTYTRGVRKSAEEFKSIISTAIEIKKQNLKQNIYLNGSKMPHDRMRGCESYEQVTEQEGPTSRTECGTGHAHTWTKSKEES